jgi:RNA polymerase sigma-70 factor (ECF subfamily)
MLPTVMEERGENIGPATIAAAREGDRDAFAAILLHFDPGLRDLAWRLLGDRQLMDDTLQTAYLKAFSAIANFRGEASIGTWLYRIAYTTCIDSLGRGRRPVFVSLDDVSEQADDGPDAAESLAVREAVAKALSSLPTEQRAAVVLVDQEGFDYKSAAEILDIPLGTLSSRLTAARAVLREALGGSRRAWEDR